MLDKLYYYRAKISAVYDGDTCTADLDLGLSTIRKGEKIRLSRINAPEV
jgi:micrococcal nuclease